MFLERKSNPDKRKPQPASNHEANKVSTIKRQNRKRLEEAQKKYRVIDMLKLYYPSEKKPSRLDFYMLSISNNASSAKSQSGRQAKSINWQPTASPPAAKPIN